MGKIDDKTDDFFDNSYHFADMWNAFMFNGKQVIKPEDLAESDRIITVKEKRNTVRLISDKTRLWQGKHLRLLILENQSHVDYHMVIRNMLMEGAAYNKQWKMLKSEHKQSNDLHDDEYLSGISKNDKFIPVITLVINFSSKKWDAACCLYDIIDIDNDDILKKYITNYKLNLFDYHDYDNFDIFKTELKNIFEVARYADDMLALGQCLNSDSSYRSLSKETIEIINDINKIKVEVIGGHGDMCKAFEDYKQLGKVEGFNEGRIEGFDKGRIEGFDEGRIEGFNEGKIEGFDEGRIEGFDEGKRTVLVAMVEDGDITIQKAAMRLNISEEEFKALLDE